MLFIQATNADIVEMTCRSLCHCFCTETQRHQVKAGNTILYEADTALECKVVLENLAIIIATTVPTDHHVILHTEYDNGRISEPAP